MKLKILLSYLIVCVFWGATYLFIKIGVETLHPLWLTGLRFSISGLIMLSYVLFKKFPFPKGIRNYIPFGIAGFFLLVMGNGFVCWSEQFVSSGLASLLAGTVPIWLALFTILFIKSSKVPLLMILGILLGFAGMVVLVEPGIGPVHFSSLKGIFGMLTAAICWSTGTLYTARIGKRYNVFVLTTFEMLFAGIVLMLLALIFQPFHPSLVSNRSWVGLAYLIIFGSCITLSAYAYLMGNAPPAWASTYAYINPVIAIILGWIVLSEPLTWNILLGAFIILVAIGIINWEQYLLSKSSNSSKSQST